MKRKFVIAMLFALCGAAIYMVAINYGKLEINLLYEQYRYPNEKFFGKEVYSEILYECTDAEKESVASVLDRADAVFSHVGPEPEADDKVGALSRYYLRSDSATEEHSLKLITAKLEKQTGIIWVVYSQKGFDSSGKLMYGSGGILARWELEQINDSWIVTNVREAP